MQTDTRTDPATFDGFAAMIRHDVRVVGTELADSPEWDWMPTIFVQRGDGSMAAEDLTPWLADDSLKVRFCEVLPSAMRLVGAARVGLLLSAWMTHHEPNADGTPVDPMDRARPREDSRRVEMLSLMVCEPGRFDAWRALIARLPEDPPVLGPWEGMSHAVELAGTFPDALRAIWGD